MNSSHLESRRWFQALTAALSVAIALPCFLTLRSALPGNADELTLALSVLGVGAFSGFDRLLTLFLPLALLKLWPTLEAPSGKA